MKNALFLLSALVFFHSEALQLRFRSGILIYYNIDNNHRLFYGCPRYAEKGAMSVIGSVRNYFLVCCFFYAGSLVAGQWERTTVPRGNGGASVSGFAFRKEIAFAGTYDFGIFFSTDNGASWNACGDRLNGITKLAVMGDTLFASTSSGLFLSADGGNSWTKLLDQGIYSLSIIGNTIFAGKRRSTDRGASWSFDSAGTVPGTIYGVAITGNGIFAAAPDGLFRITNNGDSLTRVNDTLKNARVQCVAAIEDTLFVGTDGKWVLRSTDDGASWTRAAAGLKDPCIRCLAAHGCTLFAATCSTGVFRSIDAGQSWAASNRGLKNRNVMHLAVKGHTIFAGTYGNRLPGLDPGGVFRSTDNGESWVASSKGLSLGNDIYGLRGKGDTLFADMFGGPFFSIDKGETWSEAIDSSEHLAISGDTIWDTTGGGLHLVRSIDHGATWDDCMGLNMPWYHIFYGIRGNMPFIASIEPAHLYFLKDCYDSWTEASIGPYGVRLLSERTLLASGNIIVAGINNYYGGSGLVFSIDRGTTWAQASAGLTGLSVWDLAVSGNAIAIAMNTGEILLSTDSCASWTALHEGLPRTDVKRIALCGATLFAGMAGDTIFRRDVSDLLASAPQPSFHRNAFTSRFLRVVRKSASITITYAMPSADRAHVVIYSLSGKPLIHAADGMHDAGVHSVAIRAASLPTGTYIVHFKAGSYQESTAITIMR